MPQFKKRRFLFHFFLEESQFRADLYTSFYRKDIPSTKTARKEKRKKSHSKFSNAQRTSARIHTALNA